MPQSGWIPVALGFPVVFHKSWYDPHEDTCTAGAGRVADNQSMSLLNYSSTREMQAWQMQDQMYSFVYKDTGDFLSPFLATASWADKKQKSKTSFKKVNIGALKVCMPLLMSRSA